MKTVFENEYVEVFTREHAQFILKNFVKTCNCNWIDNENCNNCVSMDNLKFQLNNNEHCYIFVRYKFNENEDVRNFRWDCNRYVSSIEDYIENDLESDITAVKYQRKLH